MRNLGIIINFDIEIDKFITRFNNSFDSVRDNINLKYFHYSKLKNLEIIESIRNTDGLLLTGSYQMLSDAKIIKKFESELEIIRQYNKPILGVCFGLHLVAYAFGFKIKALDHPDFDIENEKSLKLKISPKFDLFDKNLMNVYVTHHEEVIFKPEFIKIFQIYASSHYCQIHIIKHLSRPIYGVQFHPENPTDPLAFEDGKKLLHNFISL